MGVQPQGAVGAVGIHADGHPLLTVDKPRPVVRVWSAGTHVASLGSGKEQRDGNGKGTVARPGRIRMPAARFANTRPRVSRLFCQPGIKPRSVRTYLARWPLHFRHNLPSFFSRPRNFYVRFGYFSPFRSNWNQSNLSVERRNKKKKKEIFLSSSSSFLFFDSEISPLSRETSIPGRGYLGGYSRG